MGASQTQVVGIAVQSYPQAGERRNLMGANRTQGLGVAAFLAAFTALSAAVYSGRILLYLFAVALLAVSIAAFQKAKPWENSEN